jgi:hypothetical protein
MRQGSPLLFDSAQAEFATRRNLRTAYSEVLPILTSTLTLTAAHCGRLLTCSTAATNFTITVPSASVLGNGYLVSIRKTDIGTGTVTVLSGSVLTTLRFRHDTVTLLSDGTNWQLLEKPTTDTRPAITMTVGGITTIDTTLFGRFQKINIPVNSFTGATTENNTFRIINAEVGQVIRLFALRDGTAGTKTVNFADAGFTYRKTWSAGAFTFPVNQRHRFRIEMTAITEFYVEQQRNF